MILHAINTVSGLMLQNRSQKRINEFVMGSEPFVVGAFKVIALVTDQNGKYSFRSSNLLKDVGIHVVIHVSLIL